MSGAAGAPRSTAEAGLRAALAGRCPRCGEGALFAGPVRFVDRCPVCGLDVAAANVGDGPAAFLTLGVGTLVLALALLLEFSLRPPVVVHLLLWPVVTAALVVGGLRLAKAALLASAVRP